MWKFEFKQGDSSAVARASSTTHLTDSQWLLGAADDLTLLAVLDTGATYFSTLNQADFINYKELTMEKKMDGIAGGLIIKGTGIL